MTTTDAVLAQIADALDDWDVGPDAMRCGAPRPAMYLTEAEQRTLAREGTRNMSDPAWDVAAGVRTARGVLAAAFGAITPPCCQCGLPQCWTLTDEPGGRP